MSKVSIVYWSGTGNTAMMAGSIADGVAAAGGEAELITVDQASVDALKRLRSGRCSRCAGRSAQHRDCRRTDQQRRKEFFRQFHVPSLHEQIFCPALRRALCVVYHRQKSAVNAQIRQKCR